MLPQHSSRYFNFWRSVMDLTGVAFNTADALAIASLVIGALAVLWGAKRAIGFAGK